MSKHTIPQWSALSAFIVYMLCLAGMFVYKSNNSVFFTLLGVQAASVLFIGWVINKYPHG